MELEAVDSAVSAASSYSSCPYLYIQKERYKHRYDNQIVGVSPVRFIYRMYHVRSTSRRSVISYDVGYLVY